MRVNETEIVRDGHKWEVDF